MNNFLYNILFKITKMSGKKKDCVANCNRSIILVDAVVYLGLISYILATDITDEVS